MTAQERVRRAQHEATPAGDLTSYEGSWIAVRERRVVASDEDPVALRAHPDVQRDDVLMPVHKDGAHILIA